LLNLSGAATAESACGTELLIPDGP
jgi:hypothetical protein